MTNDIAVEVRRTGRRFDAEALLDLAADARTVWNTITDYDALPTFMPGIRACRVIERRAPTKATEHLVVEQRGEFRFLLYAQSMMVRLNIEQRPMRLSEAKATSFELGLLKQRAIDVFEGRYELTPVSRSRSAPRTHLRYTAVIALKLPPPPAIGSVAVRQNLSSQLEAVAREVHRRGGRQAA